MSHPFSTPHSVAYHTAYICWLYSLDLVHIVWPLACLYGEGVVAWPTIPPLTPNPYRRTRGRTHTTVENTQESLEKNIPIMIMHHGLCGDSNSEHVVFMVRRLLNSTRKFRIVVVIARGCGGSELLTSDTMHGARTSDLRAAIKYIRSKSPNSRIFGMSFSLGARIMLKYMG